MASDVAPSPAGASRRLAERAGEAIRVQLSTELVAEDQIALVPELTGFDAFLELAKAEPARFLVLDASDAIETIAAAIRARVAGLLEA